MGACLSFILRVHLYILGLWTGDVSLNCKRRQLILNNTPLLLLLVLFKHHSSNFVIRSLFVSVLTFSLNLSRCLHCFKRLVFVVAGWDSFRKFVAYCAFAKHWVCIDDLWWVAFFLSFSSCIGFAFGPCENLLIQILNAECFDDLVRAESIHTENSAAHQLTELEVNSGLTACANRCVHSECHCIEYLVILVSMELN